MELVILGSEVDELLRTTVGWIRAEIGDKGVTLRLQKGPFWKNITIRRIAFEEQVLVIDHDSILAVIFNLFPPVSNMLNKASVRMQGKRVYLNATKNLLASAQVEAVHTKFEKNRLTLRIRLRLQWGQLESPPA